MTDQEFIKVVSDLVRVNYYVFTPESRVSFARIVSIITRIKQEGADPDDDKYGISKRTQYGRTILKHIPPESPVFKYVEVV